MSGGEQLATVRVSRQLEAQIIKGRLESEGIPVLLSYESAGLIYGIMVDGIGEVKVMVPASMEKEARAILDEADMMGDAGSE